MKRLFIVFLLSSFSFIISSASDTIRILCIGNSFSQDAVEQELAPICESGNQPIIIGNLYFGGCSLKKHWSFLEQDRAAYKFRYIKDGFLQHYTDYSLPQALLTYEWDYISFQQASPDSGIKSSYEPYLSALIDTVRHYQPNAQLCWMQTWSYSKDSKHRAFPTYHNDQQLMTDSIHAAMIAVLERHPELQLIPCGRAIQLARESKLGDTLCRDGYHLNYSYGRYTAACVWYEFLTGKDCRRLAYKNSDMTPQQKRLSQQAAHRAMKN